MSKIDTLLSRLKGVVRRPGAARQWRALCPAHRDLAPSLTVTDDDGTILLCCQAGCRTADILERIGLQWEDLFEGPSANPPGGQPRLAGLTPLYLRSFVYGRLLFHLAGCGRDLVAEEARRRGVDPEKAFLWGWRWVTPVGAARAARALHQDFGERALQVPGIVLTDAGVRLTHNEGLLIPVRNTTGLIQGLQIRLPDARASKYRWLSSKERSVGTPTHCPLRYRPQGADAPVAEVVRVTEGPLKADVATELDPEGILTFGVAGVRAWQTALPLLARVKGLRKVRIAFDADWVEKPQVAVAIREFADALAQTLEVECEMWQLEDGKGIDDLFLAGRRPYVFTEADLKEAVT